MLLQSVSIVDLHGTLNLDIDFKTDINLLVGINGSGKTSILNTIDWLLRPNLAKLATTNYSILKLKFINRNVSYELSAHKTKSLVTLSIKGPSKPLEPITISILQELDDEDDEAYEHYTGLSPEKHERPMWDLLKSLSKPTVISLDRTISAESDDGQYVEPLRGHLARRNRVRTPITYVQEVTSAKYAEYRSKAIAYDNELKAQIVISALQYPEIGLDGRNSKGKMTESEINELERKVITYLTGTIKSGDVEKQAHSFFTSSRTLAQREHLEKTQQGLLLDFMTIRYRQIESLAKAFNDFDKKKSLAFKALQEYISAINVFFNDSNKELYFDESTGRLVFSFIETNQESRKPRIKRSVAHLSSGERQILVLFTFLAFASQSSSVFIIDEPELSLHPKWQHEFMEVFLKLRPNNTQLLLATHSPDIVGRFKNSCIILRGYKK